ncbi:MAG: prepilin peptidase [Treponemataceae bacterium]|nr:prepilin peptidase [Treponemataceae bacterium]
MEPHFIICAILELLQLIVFVYCGIRASIDDIRTQTVPRRLSITCLVLVLLINTAILVVYYYDISSSSYFQEKFWEPSRGAFIAFVLFEAVRLISNKQLGFADVLWAAIGGGMIGAIWWLSGAFLACVAGLMYFITRKEEKPIPFIPFLCGATVFMWMLKVLRFVIIHW